MSDFDCIIVRLRRSPAVERQCTAMLRPVLHQPLVALLLIAPALAVSPSEDRGRTFALNNCARCHSIDKVTRSPLKIAPPFRILHNRYPVETLAEALAEGIQTGH